MSEGFKDFIDQIPSDIYAATEKEATSNMVIFRPSSYVIDSEMYLNDYHILLPTSDPPPMRVEKRIYQFRKGRLLAFTPETKMYCTSYAPTGPYIAMCIKSRFFRDIAFEVTGKSDISFHCMNNPYTLKLLSLIHNFEEEMRHYKNIIPLMLDSISTQIIIEVLRETGNESGNRKRNFPIGQNYVNLAKEFIMSFYNANIKVEDICEHIHLSPYYFIRMFKECTGQSPHEFLLEIRVKKAEEMLRKGTYSIEEVARLCGFANTSHFSSHFKKARGLPPSQYKRKYTLIENKSF